MADGGWSQSTCRPDTLWWGVPGAGCWYATQRWGQYWVSGVVYQIYAANRWECGQLGPPVKPYGFISEFGTGEGQWFLGGVIIFRYTTRSWTVFVGDYGQTAGRLTDEPLDESLFTEIPLPEGDWTELPNVVTPKAPKPPKATKAE